MLQMAGTETKGYLPYILHNVCILTFVMIFLLYFNFDVLTSCFICQPEALIRMLQEAILPVTSLLVSMSFLECLVH